LIKAPPLNSAKGLKMKIVNTDIEYISFKFCELECLKVFLATQEWADEMEGFYEIEGSTLLVDYEGLGWEGEDILHFDITSYYFNTGWKRCIESRAEG
jgi:hypothetical protein